jgi:hypothetical protein
MGFVDLGEDTRRALEERIREILQSRSGASTALKHPEREFVVLSDWPKVVRSFAKAADVDGAMEILPLLDGGHCTIGRETRRTITSSRIQTDGQAVGEVETVLMSAGLSQAEARAELWRWIGVNLIVFTVVIGIHGRRPYVLVGINDRDGALAIPWHMVEPEHSVAQTAARAVEDHMGIIMPGMWAMHAKTGAGLATVNLGPEPVADFCVQGVVRLNDCCVDSCVAASSFFRGEKLLWLPVEIALDALEGDLEATREHFAAHSIIMNSGFTVAAELIAPHLTDSIRREVNLA